VLQALMVCQKTALRGLSRRRANFLRIFSRRPQRRYNNTVVRRHVSINGYLNSPIKGSHQLEGLLELLLANGYSIDDLMMAYVKLHMCCGETENSESRMLNTARVRSNSLSNPLSDQELLFGMKRDCVTWTFYAHDNPEFVKQLIATVPEAAPPPGPAHEFLPVIPPRQGERLLKDEDWMTDRHRQIIAAYHGPPRSLYPEEDRRLRAAAPAR